MALSEKWKKALPLFLNAAFYTALGIFAVVGTVPVLFSGIVAIVGLGVQVLIGVVWKAPE